MVYVGISDKNAHLQISALLVRIPKNQAKYVQIWYLVEKLRHWETTSDHPTQTSTEAETGATRVSQRFGFSDHHWKKNRKGKS